MDDREPTGNIDRGFVWGLVLVLLGTMMLLDRIRLTDIETYWPFLVIVVGIVRLVDPPRSGQVQASRRPGAWLVFVGLWGLVSEYRLFGFGYSSSWPLLIVGAGLMLVWRAFEGADRRDAARQEGVPNGGGEMVTR